MGYTNYWHQYNDFTDEQWNKIKEEYENYVKPLAGDEIDDNSDTNTIIFDGGCETFLLCKFSKKEPERKYKEQDLSFHFCKTNMAKYDIYVWYLLTYINRLCPEFSISRDQ
jgi:hypothetical protein|tara:strand:- start:2159 stop:2491 length:333 start_codon:yes stop_codon:yes gene_type:complete